MKTLPCLALLLLCGCFGGAPEAPSFYHPVLPPSATPAPIASGQALRLRPVQAAAHLTDRIVWRRSAAQVGYYEQERWTEAPSAYVEEALGRELFERRGLRRTSSSSAPFTVEVVVRRFEEVLLPEHQVTVELAASLTDLERTSLIERTVRISRPVPEESAEAMAGAMGAALAEAVKQVAHAVEETLAGT